MGHSEDDVVHKIPHKMKTHWQNQLKFSVLVWFTILYRTRYKKIDDRLVQCPCKTYSKVVIIYTRHKSLLTSFFCFSRCIACLDINVVPNPSAIFALVVLIWGRKVNSEFRGVSLINLARSDKNPPESRRSWANFILVSFNFGLNVSSLSNSNLGGDLAYLGETTPRDEDRDCGRETGVPVATRRTPDSVFVAGSTCSIPFRVSKPDQSEFPCGYLLYSFYILEVSVRQDG